MPFREDSMDCIEGCEDLARERRRRGESGRARSRLVRAESEHGPSPHVRTDDWPSVVRVQTARDLSDLLTR